MCRQWIGPALAATVVFAVVGGVGLIAVQLLRAPALPTAAGLLDVLVASAPVIGEWVLPLGTLAGLTALLSRWRSEGEWLALQASGVSGRHLVPAALTGGLALALATAGLTHEGAPWGRATLFDVLVHQIEPLPGRATSVGGLTVLPGAADADGLSDLLLAWEGPDGTVVASARRGRLTADRTLALAQGEVVAPQGRLAFDRLVVPLPAAVVRPPPSAWTDAELSASPEPYHRAIHHKRSTWPLASALLLLLAVPGTLSGRAWTVPGSVLAWWALVRTCDGLAPVLGGLTSALLPLVVLALVTGGSWRVWSQR